MSTKRDTKRIKINLQGSYRIWESDFPFAVLTVVNISHTGICFYTDEYVDPGSSVELKIKSEDQGELSLLAQVIWSNLNSDSDEYATGVKVMNVNSDDAKKFTEYYNSKLLYPPTD